MIISTEDRCVYCGDALEGRGLTEVSRFSFVEAGLFLNVGLAVPVCARCKTERDMRRVLLNAPAVSVAVAAISSNG